LFATPSVGKSASTDGTLANREGIRVCMQSECDSGDKLRIGLLKQCSGKDTVSARELYKGDGSFKCKAIIFHLFNEIPPCDEKDNDGFERRIEIISHPYSFVEPNIYDATKPYHKSSYETLQPFLYSKEAGASFIKILIHYFDTYGSDFSVPSDVKNEVKDYNWDNNIINNLWKQIMKRPELRTTLFCFVVVGRTLEEIAHISINLLFFNLNN
jgi:phage/plasmid-associated DNA primase